jgi:trehalose-6-phosphatase
VAKAKELLTKLASNRNNCVWVITARNPKEMTEYDSIPYLNVGSEHGAVARLNDGDKIEHDDFEYPEAKLLRDAISEMANRHGKIIKLSKREPVEFLKLRWNSNSLNCYPGHPKTRPLVATYV